MHALIITYRTVLPKESLAEPWQHFAESLRDGVLPGFISKTWTSSGEDYASFLLFEDAHVANRYLEDFFTPSIASNPFFTVTGIAHYEVDERLSAITNGLPARAAVTAPV